MSNSAETTLSLYAGRIEEALAGYIPAGSPREADAVVMEAMRYSLLGGGKRLRGALALSFFRLYHADVSPALPFACALEMIHAYSLIHDDLPCMDDDDQRRGKPSCHIAFGEATALLAGDALLTLAFQTMADAGVADRLPASRVLTAMRDIAVAAGVMGMVGGQAIDLALEGQSAPGPQLEHLARKKTGALIVASALSGCTLGGAGREASAAAARYGACLGLSFQIVDDILDATGDAAILGKPIGSDRENAKSTYVGLYGLEEAKRKADALHSEARGALDGLPGDVGFLRGLVDVLAKRQR